MTISKVASLIVSLSFIFALITPINSSNIESISNDIPDSIQEFIIHNYATSLKPIMITITQVQIFHSV